MPLTILQSDEAGVHVVTLAGSLDSGTADELTRELAPTLDAGPKKLLFDLTSVNYITSAGLGVILAAYRKVQAVGGKMRICGVTPLVKQVFDISGLSARFDLDPNRADSLANF
jgi:anti-anti-sigma factor